MKLPSAWKVKPLSELTQSDRPISYGIVQTGEPLDEGVPCVRVVDLVSRSLDPKRMIKTTQKISQSYKRTILKENDLMFALRGEIGCVAKVNKSLIGANLTRGVALIAPNSSIEPDYLLWQVKSPAVRREMMTEVNGSALQEIPIKSLRKVSIPIAPLEEQKKIAEILSTWDRAIELTDEEIRLEERRLLWILAHLNKLMTAGSEKPTRLTSVVDRLSNGMTYDTKAVLDDGLAITRIETISDGRIDYKKTGYIHESILPGQFAMKAGDILFSHINSLTHLGKVAFYDGRRPLIHGMNLLLIRANEKIRPKLLFYFLRTPNAKKYVASRAKKAINQASINTTELEQMEMHLPSPKLQEELESAIESIEVRAESLRRKSDLLKTQKQGLMQKLLTGKVRVKV